MKKEVKTNFDELSNKIYDFEKLAGFDKSSEEILIKALKNEITEYESCKNNIKKKNKLMDIIVLALQISRRKKFSMDKEWAKYWKKNKKYLGKDIEKYKKKFYKEIKN